MTLSARERARLNVEGLIAAMLERVPAPTVARTVEAIARDHAASLESTISVTTWHHDGMRAFVRELAERLAPGLVGPDSLAGDLIAEVRARAALARGPHAHVHWPAAEARAVADELDELDGLLGEIVARSHARESEGT